MAWDGELIRLVPLDRERHFENCLRWINDSEVTTWLGIGDMPVGRKAEDDWFTSMEAGSGTDIVFAIETLEGVHIGNSGIHGIDFRNGTAKTGSYVAEANLRGKGYGTDAARVRSKYCFDVLGLRLLLSEYYDGNTFSARMQEKAGYLEYGRLPQALWKRGAYRDLVMTHLSRERWLALEAGEVSS